MVHFQSMPVGCMLIHQHSRHTPYPNCHHCQYPSPYCKWLQDSAWNSLMPWCPRLALVYPSVARCMNSLCTTPFSVACLAEDDSSNEMAVEFPQT